MQKQSEQELALNPGIISVLDSITDGFLTLDEEWRITYLNETAQRLMGRPDDDLTGQNFWHIFAVGRGTTLEAQYRRAMSERVSLSFEQYFDRIDCWFELNVYPIKDDGLAIYGRDITSRKQAEEKLQKTNERFEIAEALTNGFIYDWDVPNDTVWRSEGFYSVLGYAPGEIAFNSPAWFDLIHPDDWPAVQSATDKRRSQRQKHQTLEYRVRHQAGHYLIMQDRSLAYYDEQGQYQRMNGSSIDITERVRHQQNTDLLAEINADFATLSDTTEIMQSVAVKLHKFLNLLRVAFVKVDKSHDQVTNLYDYGDAGSKSGMGLAPLSKLFSPTFISELSAGKAVVINDLYQDPRTAPFAANYQAYEVGSQLFAPYQSDGQWKFVLVVQKRTAYQWREDEIALAREIANRIWPRLERAWAEEALRASEEKYRTLFNSIDEGFFMGELIYNEAGQPVDCRVLEVNRVFERQTGLKNAVGKLGSEIAPNTEPYWFKLYDRLVQTGESVRFENYNQTTGRWYLAYCSRVGEASSRLFVSVFSDITERKNREQHQEFLLKLSDALRFLSDPIQIEAEACRVLGEYLNVDRTYYSEINEAENYTRVNQNYLRGDSPSIVGTFPLSDYDWGWQRLLRGETVVVSDVSNSPFLPHSERAATIETLKIAAIIAVPLIRAGKLVGALAVNELIVRQWSAAEIEVVGETAERTWATIEQARAEAASRDSEERFRQVAEVTNDIIWEWNLQTDYWWWNEGITSLFGYAINQLDSSVGWWRNHIHPNDRARVVSSINAAIEGGKSSWSDEYRFLRADGSYVYVTDRGSIIYSQSSSPTERRPARMLGAMVDVTRQKREEEQTRFLIEFGEQLRPLSEEEVVFEQAARLLGEYLKVNRCYFAELDPANRQLIHHPDYRKRRTMASLVGTYSLNTEGWAEELAQEAPLLVSDTNKETIPARFYRQLYEGTKMRSLLVVPLLKDQSKKRKSLDQKAVVLMVGLEHHQPRLWLPEEIRLVKVVLERVGLAVQNARLLRQTQLAAIVEERNRIARYLHDSLQQDFYGIQLQANTLRVLLTREGAEGERAEQLSKLQTMVNEILLTAEGGLSGLRTVIFDLRTEAVAKEGLVAGLKNYLASLSAKYRLNITDKLGAEPELKLEVKEALYWIAREALYNILKHSEASEVEISLYQSSVTPPSVELIIRDNGRGFEPHQVDGTSHAGLGLMRERAEQWGGKLTIDTKVSSGTTVRASF